MKDRCVIAAIVCACACLLLPLVAGAPSWAAETKIGVINLSDMYSKSARVKAAIEEMQKLRQEATPKMAALNTEINKLQEDLNKGKDTLKAEEAAKIQKDIDTKVEELKNEQQAVRVKLTYKQKSLQNVLRTQITQIVENLAKEEGLTTVLLKDSVAYAGPGVTDITEKALKALDAMPALEKGPQE